jgi:uncharacterized protein
MANMLPKIELGNTGFSLGRFGLGGFHQVEISSEIVHQVVDTFQEVGGNYIETARGYGQGASEIKLGRALRGRRDQFVLCSKSGAERSDDIRRDLEITLDNLQTDHIEFYYLHGVPDMDKLDTITGADGALAGLLKAKDEGLIKGIGFSSHRLPMYIEALNRLPLSLILIWSNYLEDMHFPEISRDIFPLAKQKGVGITSMKPLADGFLYRSATNAIRWSLGSGGDVLICGTNSPAHVREVADAVCAGPFDEAEREETLKNAVELGSYVCRQCGKCSDEIENVFRLEGFFDRQMVDYLEHDPANYALRLRLSGWFSLEKHARKFFEEMDADESRLFAEAADVKCPYDINIPRKLKIALAKLKHEDPNLV